MIEQCIHVFPSLYSMYLIMLGNCITSSISCHAWTKQSGDQVGLVFEDFPNRLCNFWVKSEAWRRRLLGQTNYQDDGQERQFPPALQGKVCPRVGPFTFILSFIRIQNPDSVRICQSLKVSVRVCKIVFGRKTDNFPCSFNLKYEQ